MFSLGVVGCFFLCIELVLFLIGVKPKLSSEDPFVGFAPSIPLFVHERQPTGQVQAATAQNKLGLFNLQQFPVRKPANTVRIFCVGGSTTYGFPYDDATSFSGWLRESLPLVAPERDWEVVNAGANSYASYRVLGLMPELCQYAPDLFIIYCGHNEFLEQQTYGPLLNAPQFLLGAETLAMRTRVYTAMEALINSLSGQHASQGLGIDILTLNQDQVAGPEVYTRDDQLREKVLQQYRVHLERMIETARSASAQVVLIVPAQNLKDFSPYKSEHRAGLSAQQLDRCTALLRQSKQDLSSSAFQEALEACAEFLAIDDRYALAHFRRGEALHALGQFDAARQAFQRACDEDVCALRALSAIQDAVRDIGAKHQVPVVDFARVIERESEHGIAGKKHFLDDVHPTVKTHGLLAAELRATLGDAGVIPPQKQREQDVLDKAAKVIEARVDRHKQAEALFKVAWNCTWSGKWEESLQMARQAAELSPESRGRIAAIHWKYGEHLLQERQWELAGEQFQQIVAWLPDDAAARERLRIAQQRAKLATRTAP